MCSKSKVAPDLTYSPDAKFWFRCTAENEPSVKNCIKWECMYFTDKNDNHFENGGIAVEEAKENKTQTPKKPISKTMGSIKDKIVDFWESPAR